MERRGGEVHIEGKGYSPSLGERESCGLRCFAKVWLKDHPEVRLAVGVVCDRSRPDHLIDVLMPTVSKSRATPSSLSKWRIPGS